MHIQIIQHLNYAAKEAIHNKVTVVIDVLRATSVITTALAHGAKSVIVTNEIDEALTQFNQLGINNCLLGGERKMKKIVGFHYGNSPASYACKKIRDKIIILTTTNGTRAINFSKHAIKTYIGSFLNGEFLALELARQNSDIAIVCAGTSNEFSLDDALCAGMLLSKISEYAKLSTDDLGTALKNIYENNQNNISDLLTTSKSYSELMKNGYQNDIEFCLRHNVYSIAPKYINGQILI